MFKFTIHISTLVLCFFSVGQVTAQVLCMKSVNSNLPIRLKLSLPGEHSSIGKIKYERGTNEITILRLNELRLTAKSTVPAAIKTRFSEIVDGTFTGSYFLTTQGGAVGELTYQKKNRKKLYKFIDDQESYIGESCNWSN